MNFRLALALLVVTNIVSSQKKGIAAKSTIESEINATIDNWHKAAAEADYDTYFDLMTKDAVFIGTDPTENWQNTAFRVYSKPHFDNGKAWTFYTLERNVYNGVTEKMAWFDELLDTQMGICRGSGILQKEISGWKIRHYVLSMTIPNESVQEVKGLKESFDTMLRSQRKK